MPEPHTIDPIPVKTARILHVFIDVLKQLQMTSFFFTFQNAINEYVPKCKIIKYILTAYPWNNLGAGLMILFS